jgi:F0F1-type ATP synthase assembly protein I
MMERVMDNHDSRHATADANESMQTNLNSNEPTIFAAYGLIGAILLFGAAGYLLDQWLHSSPWLLLCGLATGLAVGFFGLLKAVKRRST